MIFPGKSSDESIEESLEDSLTESCEKGGNLEGILNIQKQYLEKLAEEILL